MGPTESHPAVVITAIVNTATELNRDHNYLLHPGDHPFINRLSIVNYSSLKILQIEHLKLAEALSGYKSYDDQLFRWHSALGETILTRIIEGALTSRATPRDMKAELRARLDET